MVVERDLPVHVWGMAAPGEQVTVTFRDETRTTRRRPRPLEPLSLTRKSRRPLSVDRKGLRHSSDAITLDDILVGDVWVASGQSNMEFGLRQAATAADDLPNAANPQIRLLLVTRRASDYPQDDLQTEQWVASSPDTAKDFSAVAWYFAREISKREHVAVGVIDATWGGTVAEAWTRLGALGEDAALAPLFVSRAKMTEAEPDALLRRKRLQDEHDQAVAQGKPAQPVPWHPDLASWGPAELWNGMIAPLTPLPIRGVIWYQGESNSALERAPLYGRVFRTLIEDWRRQWAIGDFPFLYAQISSFKSGPGEDWALLREQPVRTLELRNTAMAVTIDIGNPDNVHPTDKVDVGLRLALAARALSYGEPVEYSGPMYRQVTPRAKPPCASGSITARA